MKPIYLLNVSAVSAVLSILTVQTSLAQTGAGTSTNNDKVNWSVNPFDNKLFIENHGQFKRDIKDHNKEPILFGAILGDVKAYFTVKGINYCYTQYDSIKQGEDPDETGPPEHSVHFAGSEWENSNPKAFIEPLEKQNYYCTYDAGNNRTIKADAFKKMICHDLYRGIDVVYTFPGDEKTGIEYALIVHPGADLSQVKIKYTGIQNVKQNSKGDVIWTSDIGEITEHAPVAYYENDVKNTIKVSYTLQNNGSKTGHETIESFTIDPSFDRTKTLVIDPWISDPQFTSPNTAYEMDYDYAGNVYVYGGTGYELVKLNSLGVKQWMFTATTLALTGPYIGGMCTDKKSECCYMSEGWNAGAGASRSEKVSTLGILMGTNPGNSNMNEIWRLKWDACTHLVYGSGNGTCCPYQACQIDTNMLVTNVGNICAPIVNANGFHDFGCLAIDPLGGYMYTACSRSLSFQSIFNNYVVKCPIPAFSPAVYQLPVHYGILEWSSYHFAGNLTNGFSGAAASPAWLYLYQGDTIKQINKTTGAINAVKMVSATPYQWGGVDADYCDNVYIGNSTNVEVYNSALSLSNTYSMTGTIYDVKVNTSLSVVYACGAGFVTEVSIPSVKLITTTNNAPSSCGACDGSATANVTCGAGPFTYLWNTGQTTSTITGLCAGIYTVTIQGISCNIDTAVANIPGKPGYTATVVDSNPGCALFRGNITAYPTGGTAPYTYAWSNGETNQKDTGLVAGTYTCVITDAGGCKYTLSVTLVNPTTPTISVSPQNDTICKGSNIVVTASGAKTYSWTPATGLSCNNCPNPTASPTITTTYTVNAADSNGCTGSSTVTVAVRPIPAVSINPPKDTICQGNGVTLVASGATTYHWSPSNGLSCINCPNPLASPTVTTLYTVVGTDTHGCTDTAKINLVVNPVPTATITVKPANDTICRGDSALLKVTGGCTYKWTFNNSTSDSIYVKPLSNNTYFVQVSCNGCSIFVNKLVNVIGSFVANVSGKDSVCAGDSALWTASGGATYKWLSPLSTNSPTVYVKNNTTYSCVITSTCGTDTIKRAMHVLSVPVIGFIGDTAICSGKNASFNASGGGSYTWTPPASGLSCYNCPNPTATPATSTTYTLTIANGMCSHDTIIHLSVNKPTDSINHPPRTCLGTCVTLNAYGGGTYQWSNGATTSSIQVCPTSDTTLKVKIISHGCPITDSIVVNVSAPGFKTSGDDTIELGDTAHLHATGAQGYIWSPATGLSCTTCPNPVADPSVTTTYTIISTDSIGCTSSKTLTVYVETPCADFNVPNVFTPNDDGINDDFVVNVLNPSSYNIIIYDRWGKQMYKSTDATVYWSGRINGTQNLAPDGVYYYIIKATCASNDYTKKGFVQLIGEK